jgi:hypothetical protein
LDARAAKRARTEALTLTDVAWIVAKNGYAADVWRCCGINRAMWRWIDPRWTAEQAACVRRDHPFWQAIINLPHGSRGETRLILAAKRGRQARVATLIAWHADVSLATIYGWTALISASASGHVEVVCGLLAAGANKRLATRGGSTAHSLAANFPDKTAAIHAQLDLAP